MKKNKKDKTGRGKPVAMASPTARQADFTKIEVCPFGMLVITDAQGSVRGMLSGESAPLAKLLTEAHARMGMVNPPVRKMMNSLTPLGQDMYEVDVKFVLGVKSLLWNWEGASELETILPADGIFTFVINY